MVIRRKSLLPLMASSLTRMLSLLSADTRTRLLSFLLATLLMRHRLQVRLRTVDILLPLQEQMVMQRLLREVVQFMMSRVALFVRSRVSWIPLIELVRFLMARSIR